LETVLHSCGIADTIATSFGGRNRLVSEEYAKRLLSLRGEEPFGINKAKPGSEKKESIELKRASAMQVIDPHELEFLWGDIEAKLLAGQKIQGLGTCEELMACMAAQGLDKMKVSGSGLAIESYDSYSERVLKQKNAPLVSPVPTTLPTVGAKKEPAAAPFPYKDTSSPFRRDGRVQSASHYHSASAIADPTPKIMPGLRFGLFSRIHAIAFNGDSPRTLFDW
jgi:hypothetical protein